MRVRLMLAAVVVSTWFACQCGPGASTPCDGIRCGSGLTCEPTSGRCVVPGTGGGSDGGSGTGGTGGSATGGGQGGSATGGGEGGGAGTGGGATGGSTAGGTGGTTGTVCATNAQCGGTTPYCDPAADNGKGRCFECINLLDCPDPSTHCEALTRTCVPDNPNGTPGLPVFDDAGMTTHCLSAPPPSKPCTSECGKGFTCVAGNCELNGKYGPVQVTLRFNQPQDLDLYLVEPLPDGGSCEIYYQNPNTPPFDGGLPFPLPFPIPVTPSCGALGYLDLDSNRACDIDNVDTENIIFPANKQATRGHYIVRANFYQSCQSLGPVPWEVTVRANGQVRYYCGSFQQGASNGGAKGAGQVVTTFDIQ